MDENPQVNEFIDISLIAIHRQILLLLDSDKQNFITYVYQLKRLNSLIQSFILGTRE